MVWRQVFAELHGTAMWAFIIFASSGNGYAVGIGLWVIIVSTGGIGGAHFNPIVTTGVIIRKKITGALTKEVFDELKWYYPAQLIGAFAGSWLALAITDSHFGFKVQHGSSYTEAFIAETICSGQLVLVILVSSQLIDSALMKYLSVAFTIMASVITVGRISGACFNPSICVAVDVVKAIHFNDLDYLKHIWVFIAAPFLGCVWGTIMAFIYLSDKKFTEKELISETPMTESLIKEDEKLV